MHIILVSNRLATARTLRVTPRALVVAAGALAFMIFATSLLFFWLSARFNLPFLPFTAELVAAVQEDRNRKNEEYLKNNLSSMAVKLGEMQTKLIHIDTLGERLSKVLGVKPESAKARNDGQGGPLIVSSRPLEASQLQQEIDRFWNPCRIGWMP